MANPEHLAILKQGVKQWNEWRKEHPDVRPNLRAAIRVEVDLRKRDLTEANLHGADLNGADLSEAVLSGANLSLAVLSWTNLSRTNRSAANLSEANLSGVHLGGADLSGAELTWAILSGNLSQANLSEANLFGASLHGGNLGDTDFTKTMAGGTKFANVDLSVAKGLETIVHHGPSTVGIDTIHKSRGKIPEAFLRGCGLADWEIQMSRLYDPSLSSAETTDIAHRVVHLRNSQPFQFYSCFISYADEKPDNEFAEQLYADLQAKGVRCWFAPHDIQGGRKIHEQIDEAIRLHDKLLLILSEHSMSSDWVQTEIAKARKREAQEKRQMLFPVALVPYDVPPHEAPFGLAQGRPQRRSAGTSDKPATIKEWELINSAGEDVAEKIREYFIPDFSNWKEHDSYQKAFQRLVSDLKAESK